MRVYPIVLALLTFSSLVLRAQVTAPDASSKESSSQRSAETLAPISVEALTRLYKMVRGDGFDPRRHFQDCQDSAYGLEIRRLADQDGDSLDELWISGLSTAGGEYRSHVVTAKGVPLGSMSAGGFRTATTFADLDGDGRPDIVVGQCEMTYMFCLTYGVVRRFSGFGPRQGPPSRPPPLVVPLHGSTQEVHLGAALEAVVDLDGDGHVELAVGTPSIQSFMGGGVPPPKTCAVSIYSFGSNPPVLLHKLLGDESGDDGFGAALAFGGDFDGDGVGDLAVGAPRASGAAAGAGRVQVFSGATWREIVRFEGELQDENLGHEVRWAPDLDGDARSELVATAPRHAADRRGRLLLFSSMRRNVLQQLEGLREGAAFGASLAIGDLDGDERPELVVGAPGAWHRVSWPFGEVDVFDLHTGALRLRIGSDALPPPVPEDLEEWLAWQPFESWSGLLPRFGRAFELARLDHEPGLDLVIGAPVYRDSKDAGCVWVFSGAELARSFAPLP